MRLVPVKSAEQLDLQALHRYRERLVPIDRGAAGGFGFGADGAAMIYLPTPSRRLRV